MSCGGPKKFPRTSSIVQIIFSFWSFEISEGTLGYQNWKKKCLDSFSKHISNITNQFRFDQTLCRLSCKICKITVIFSSSFCQFHRVTDAVLLNKTAVWPIFFPLNIITALNGTHFQFL